MILFASSHVFINSTCHVKYMLYYTSDCEFQVLLVIVVLESGQ